jgi:hypothetical protein
VQYRHEAQMPPALPICPHLPLSRPGLDWRALHAFRVTARGADFYVACLEYAHALWRRRLPARAILCLDRAFGAELRGDEVILEAHPLPYVAMRWIIEQAPPELFIGNPRIHFQHYADRMNEPRREQRRWRAWACWAIVRAIRPGLPADLRHQVEEPTIAAITDGLRENGFPNEELYWTCALK